jgi:two-component system sensor histidine kinase/response regulator
VSSKQPKRKLRSIRAKTAMLVLACALPTVLGFAALGVDSYERERGHLLHDATAMSAGLLRSVDAELDSVESVTRALSNSLAIPGGDLKAFHAQAKALLRPEFPVEAIILSRADGAALVHTDFAPGAVLPDSANASRARLVADNTGYGGPGVTPAPSKPQALRVTVDVPVRHDGKVTHVVTAMLRAPYFNGLISTQALPPRWTAQVFDNEGTILARTLAPEKFVGQKARPQMLAARDQAPSGVIELTSREGVNIMAAYTVSSRRGWFVTIGLPSSLVRELLIDSMSNMLLSVAGLLAIGMFTAWTIGGRIANGVRALRGPAVALGRGEPLVLPPMRIKEVAEVGDVLRQVEHELNGYRHGLEDLVHERTAELERSTALLETVYASAPAGMALLDRDLRVVMVNDYLATINAVPVEDHLGRTLPEILGPLGVEYEKAYRQVLETGEPLIGIEGSGEVPATPGKIRHWLVNYHPVFGADHLLVGISSVVLEITALKEMEQRVRDNDEQFRVLYELSADAHVMIDMDGRLASGNPAAIELFGCASLAQFQTLTATDVGAEFQANGERSPELLKTYIRQALERSNVHFDWLCRRVDGSIFNADIMLTSVKVGGRTKMHVSVRDITERIAADAALRATSEQLAQNERFIRTVTDNLPGMVGYWDSGLRCRFANKAYLAWHGLDAEAMLGRTMAELVNEEVMAVNTPYLRGVFAGKAQKFERSLPDKSGAIVYQWVNYIPDFDENGTVRGFYLLNSDVSDIKRGELRLQNMNYQLVQALDKAQRASRAKSEFLANMSHEIRTPMNAIMGLARLLEEAPLERRERGYVSKMKISTRSLLGILNDILDFSKIEAGQLNLEMTPFSLEQVLGSIGVLVAPNAWAKGVEPVFAVAADVPAQLVGDPMRLEQVLLNLIGNAVKFTEQGDVVLTVRVAEHGGDYVRLAFSVRDSGIGIAPEHQATMFEAFSQGDTSTSRKYGGTGLGLAICRRLVNLMGGSIGVRSELGRGAEFHFETRFGVVPGAAPPAADGAALRVLVADDNVHAAAAIADSCRARGWEVDCVHRGADALALLQRPGSQYDLMFIDSAMPDMDGISVITHARGTPGARMPRFAMMIAEDQRERLLSLAEDLALDAILSKPVTPAALADAIGELRGGGAPHAAANACLPLAGRLQGMRVLVVEDNQINQEVATYLLTHAGAAVDIAADGRIAVSTLAENPGRYDAVLMDIQMPVMNGYEATVAIRQMGLLTLPVVAMTANALEDDLHQAEAAGMDGHVAKPIDIDVLVSTLLRVTKARPAPVPAAAPVAPAPVPQPQQAPASLPGIDMDAALKRFGGDYDYFASLFRRFEQSQGATLAEVRALLDRGQAASAAQALHRMRGVAANLGAVELAERTLALEKIMASGGDLAAAEARVEAAMAVVLASARSLAVEPEAAPAKAEMHDLQALQAGLADLLGLLQNNNLKAIAAFQHVRGPLASLIEPAAVVELADAVETLSFTSAAALVNAILNRGGSA